MKAYILAGGRGMRLSPDKGFLTIGGRTLLERVCAAAEPLATETVLVGEPEPLARTGRRIIQEAAPSGPLAGLGAALADAGPEDVLLLPWDAPFISTKVLRYLRDVKGTADAVVPRRGDRPEPLFAIYGPRCRAPAERALARGERRVIAFYDDVLVSWVGEKELANFGDWDTLFLNVNTPEDLERARRMAEGQA